MKSSMNSKHNSSTSPKSKKNTKERDKRRPEYVPPAKIDPPQLIEIAFMGETTMTKSYARLGRESILNYAEQTIYEHPSSEISYSLAEDLSYKLRHIIHDAITKAHLSGRTCLMSSDIDATFANLSLDKVYGASNTYNFIPFTDKNLYYLDDTIVNLVDLAEETGTVIQPGNVIMTKACYPEVTASSKHYVKYFEKMCFALICNTAKLRQEALRDIRSNARIGPIVNWFYHFGYFLLSKNITYDSLTLCALDLIRMLEENCVAIQIVSEKELKLLVRLILQRLLRSPTTIEVIKPMCNVLALLCTRLPLREQVTKKISQRMREFKVNATVALISILNELESDAIDELLANELDFFLSALETSEDINLYLALMKTYRLLCVNKEDATAEIIKYHWQFYEAYNYALCPLWRKQCHCSVEKLESNWRFIKSQLLKSRRRVPSAAKTCKKYELLEVFEDGDKVQVKKLKASFKHSKNVFPVEVESDNNRKFPKEVQHGFVDSEQKIDVFVTIGTARHCPCFADRKVQSCLDHASFIIS